MARDLYVYDVFDIETDIYILEGVPLNKVTNELGVDKCRVINAIKYGQKIKNRYKLSRTYLDGTKNPDDAEEKVVVPIELQERWDEARFAARRALRNPRAIRRFLEKQRSRTKKVGCV